jgi:hypothetical protein
MSNANSTTRRQVIWWEDQFDFIDNNLVWPNSGQAQSNHENNDSPKQTEAVDSSYWQWVREALGGEERDLGSSITVPPGSHLEVDLGPLPAAEPPVVTPPPVPPGCHLEVDLGPRPAAEPPPAPPRSHPPVAELDIEIDALSSGATAVQYQTESG